MLIKYRKAKLNHLISNPPLPVEQQIPIPDAEATTKDDTGRIDHTAHEDVLPAISAEHSSTQVEQPCLPAHRPESVVQGRSQSPRNMILLLTV